GCPCADETALAASGCAYEGSKSYGSTGGLSTAGAPGDDPDVPFPKKGGGGEGEDASAHLISAKQGAAGYLCLRARDGAEALTAIERESPDLVILDILMPKLDGIEVVRRLKADPVSSRVPVLMLTSLAGVDDRVRGLEAGADDYLSKP